MTNTTNKRSTEQNRTEQELFRAEESEAIASQARRVGAATEEFRAALRLRLQAKYNIII